MEKYMRGSTSIRQDNRQKKKHITRDKLATLGASISALAHTGKSLYMDSTFHFKYSSIYSIFSTRLPNSGRFTILLFVEESTCDTFGKLVVVVSGTPEQ
mmetsp:Transcript_35017/g.72917  ORF Transcript_35017/g.72917 Transcript_35017/m.72917 type:complete len:99 (-) Transcript_35017:289-585(-)